MLGDAHAQDFAVACGYAIRDPEAADAGMSALQGDDEAEATLAMKMAQGFASKLMQMQQPQEPPRAPTQRTMSGFGERRTTEENKAAGPTLWGLEAQQA